MMDSVYNLLARLGYEHPVHPVFVHVPIGMTIGAFCLAALALILGRRELMQSAGYVIALALVFLVPAIATGIGDWLRFYSGAWLFPVKMKLLLATLMVVLLIVAAVLSRRPRVRPAALLIVYAFAVADVSSLGYFGGDLVYAGRVPDAPEPFQVGRNLFESHCSGCHQRGGNIIMPNLALRSAPQLRSFDEFLSFLRDPRLPDGSPGPMPPFPEQKISEPHARELYDYIHQVFVTPVRE